MGRLIDGKWSTQWYDTANTGGKFVRSQAGFRNWVTTDGSPGPSGEGGFAAEADRYHLYVSLACPWAHRTLIFRKLKELDKLISVSVVSPKMPDETGWSFKTEEGSTGDALFGKQTLWQVYTEAEPEYTGRVTVPVLWDKKTGTIVSNESSEIIRMFNSAFNELTGNTDDYYPADLRETTESDILYGLDRSTQARAVREVAGRHLAQVRDAYRKVLGDPGEQLTAQLAEFTTARDALSAQLEHLARLEGDN